MFSVGLILGLRPDFGLSEIYRFWVHFGGVGWAGMGWVGCIELDSEFRAAVFGQKLVFRRFWAMAGTFLCARKPFLRQLISDLRISGLDSGILMYLGSIGIGIPRFAFTGFDNDDDRRRQRRRK